MNRLTLALFSLLFSSMAWSQVQIDADTVQTFTFSDISNRRATYQFPDGSESYEKVLMLYTLKCDPQTPWDSYDCGEWDYLAYTKIYDHTGVYDSTRIDSVQYLANYESNGTYVYDPIGSLHYDSYRRAESYRTGVTSSLSAVNGIANSTSNFPFDVAQNGSKFQMIIKATDMQTAGLTAGNLQSLALNVDNFTGNGDIINPTIRLKETTLTEITSFETTGFTEVYNATRSAASNVNALVNGQNEFVFTMPFAWNGTDNIIVEFEFDRPHSAANTIDFDAVTTTENLALGFSGNNGSLSFDGSQKALLELSDFDLGDAFTISFWAKGNGNTGQNTSILEAYDTLNNRVINIHFPWSNNDMYFDAGAGSNYDRIQTPFPTADIDNVWNHWSFTKDANSGEMRIYKNGVLFHSGSGNNMTLGEVHRVVLGSGRKSNNFWNGKIDEFQIYDVALDQTTIAANYEMQVTPSHPNYANLLVYYNFDNLPYAVDGSANNYLLMPSAYDMIDFSENAVAGVKQVMELPTLSFGTSADVGTVNAQLMDYNKLIEPQTVFEFAEVDHHFEIVDAFMATPSGVETTYDENLQVESTNNFTGAQTINNTQITYYEEPYEIVPEIEIGRFITPYGIGFDLGPNGFTWVYDVTDYQYLLEDDVDISAHNTQELIDLKFVFVKGTPPRDIIKIDHMWERLKSYTYENLVNDAALPATTLNIDPATEMMKVKTRITGHGHQPNTNQTHCCEWFDIEHRLNVNGTQHDAWSIWQECAINPNISQGGTWPYDREGWCPGDKVPEYEFDVSEFSNDNQITIDYEPEDVLGTYPGFAQGNFVMNFDLVQYGAPNFQVDAAISDIKNPTSKDYYRNFNPTCQDPVVVLKNTGANTITSARIVYWTGHANYRAYEWTGNLEFLEETEITLPIDDYGFWYDNNGLKKFRAQVELVNGQTDEYEQNNYMSVDYESVERIDGDFVIWVQENNNPGQNSYYIKDHAGNIVFSRENMQSDAITEYKDTITGLAPGCYTFEFYDTGDDGISFWASNETSGFVRLRQVGGSMIETFNGDFGRFIKYGFTVGFGLSNEEIAQPQMKVYPNPTKEIVNIELDNFSGSEFDIDIFNAVGQQVKRETIVNNANQFIKTSLDVSSLTPGVYWIKMTGEGVTTTEQLVIQ